MDLGLPYREVSQKEKLYRYHRLTHMCAISICMLKNRKIIFLNWIVFLVYGSHVTNTTRYDKICFDKNQEILRTLEIENID